MKRVFGAVTALPLLLAGVVSCGPAGEEPWDVEVAVGGLAPGPLEPRRDHSLVWTGAEVLVWGGHGASQHAPFPDGAAYSPTADTWRPVAASGLEPRTRHSTVVVGERVLVWGGFTPTHSGGPDAHLARDGALYDPGSDSWEPVARAPEGRSLARGVAVDGRVVLGGGFSQRGGSDFLVYSPKEDSWHTVPLAGGDEGFTVYDIAVLDDTVVAVGSFDARRAVPVGGSAEGGSVAAEDSGMFVTVFGADDAVAPVRLLSGLAEAGEASVFTGVAVSPEGRALLALRGEESASLYEIGADGRAKLVDRLDSAGFRPPVSSLTYPLLSGEMDFVDGLGLVATAPGEVGLWDPEAGRSRRLQVEALSGHCGPLVPAADGVLFGWGGLGCGSTGIRVDIGA
ncbi:MULTISPECIES: kelch repeat-containing protein [unclassified Nocardiopsis]|uniref:Kelch repeat-containing protein n=1 Tax=unclassified Nocardiopsis TaxID=2649073 RepID=UPI00135797C2|nr:MULTISPECIES: kelch repeat-containing protein [unclassified Nocardiopsis]